MTLEDKMKLLIQLLKNKGIEFAKGLTNDELKSVETNFDFRFPPDLKILLCMELPVSKGFVDWKKALTSSEYENEVLEVLRQAKYITYNGYDFFN
jgi:hypothetical protein